VVRVVDAQYLRQALAQPRYLLSSWPLRAVAYLLGTGLAGLLTLVVALLLLTLGGVLAVVVVGIPMLAALALIGLPVGAVERRLLRIVDRWPVPHAHRTPHDPGFTPWLRTRFAETDTWRELGHAALLMLVLWPIDLLAVTLGVTVPLALLATPVLFATVGDGEQVNVLKAYAVTSWPVAFAVGVAGLVAVAASAYGLGLVAAARYSLARVLLTRAGSPLGARITELTDSRVRLVDAFEAERGRIERDLHDGAQQRLVALTMMLGVARLDAPPGPVAEQLARAHDEAGRVLVELRELIRGIHPPLLVDFGLEAAVTDLADRSVIPVDVALTLPHRFAPSIESTVYFVVSEALSNMAKHSAADHGEISGDYSDGWLVVTVTDNGRGGAGGSSADPDAGTGLVGLADRVSVVDGTLSVSSPPGGPTRLTVEIPCQPLPASA
jgi:signal transduction histidine kinase